MKKKDLKTGMRVQTRDGDEGIVVISEDLNIVSMPSGSYFNIGELNDDMIHPYANDVDIMKVWAWGYYHDFFLIDKKGNVLFEREEKNDVVEIDGIEYSMQTLRSLIKRATS